MSETSTTEELGLGQELSVQLVRAKREAASSRSKSTTPSGKRVRPGVPPGYALIKLEALERLATLTGNVPLLILVRLEETWAGPTGRTKIKLGALEADGRIVSEQEKSRGLAALRKAGLVR